MISKKYLLAMGMSALFILGACSQETQLEEETQEEQTADESAQEPEATEEVNTEEQNDEEEAESSSEASDSSDDSMSREEFEEENMTGMADEPTEERDFSNATEDVMEFVERNDKDIYVDGPHDYIILERYEIPEVHESGLNRLDIGGYRKEFALLLVEDEFGQKKLAYGGTHYNDTEFSLDYNGGIQFVTDTGEQVDSEAGIASDNQLIEVYSPGVERTDIMFTDLENQEETPQSITLTLPQLIVINDEGAAEIHDPFFEGETIELSKAE